jgi:hypothetical protein
MKRAPHVVRLVVGPVIGLLLALAPAFAQAPVRTENLIYSILAYNGKDYSPTFARTASPALYLIADADSFLTVRKTLVYFWPLTGEWKTSMSALDVPIDGVLEITDRGGAPIRVIASRYTYYNERGDYELNWKVARDAEADRVWAHWSEIRAAYEAAMKDYRDRLAKQQESRASLIVRIQRLRNEGRDVEALVDQLADMKEPDAPQQPQDYVVPPAEIQQAFILNLPSGQYSMRFRMADGSVLEGSEKTLVVHKKRRSRGVGYDVIPGDKWTRPVESPTPSAILYVDGSSDLFLRPYFEDEYNDLYYSKTIRNDTRGNPNLMKWERIQQVPHAGIELTGGGTEKSMLQEEPWFVEQSQGSTLGYRIVPYDPLGAQKGKDPSLIAFRVPLGPGSAVTGLRTVDAGGSVLPGSERQIRVIAPPAAEPVLPILALIPLGVMAFVLVRRARKYRR